MEQQPQQTASAPQIRSRITVVCAECKRLKLKCDRRSPCSSCTKRDTVARCIYSPAAAEKVDLHSLNNRLMQVEATLAQLTSGTFQSSYPPAQPQNVPGANPLPPVLASSAANPPSRNNSFPTNSHQHHHHPAAVTTHVHESPCPLALSLDELRSAWLDSVESGRSSRTPGRSGPPIKLELSPVEVERQTRLRANLNPASYPHSRHPNPQPFLPPASLYYPAQSQSSYGSPSYTPPMPSVTPAVMDLLPTTAACMRILARAKMVLSQRPVPLPGGWGRFQRKALNLFSRRPGVPYSAGPGDSAYPTDGEADSDSSSSIPRDKKRAEEGLPFFAITCAVLAIGTSVSPPELLGGENINAGFLYALSQQALSVWETASLRKSERDHISFLVACLAGIGYLLIVTPDTAEDSEELEDQNEAGGKARAIFPLVGKMVNVAREIGLGKEKAAWQEGGCESGARSRSERQHEWEDFRRTVWWDVMFYDLFTSDALGHPSLISPMSYSPQLPDLSGNVYEVSTKKYVSARCRLVHLAQRVRHRLSHPDCCCGYTFDQATTLEDEIRRWSRESLVHDDDEKDDERRHTWELSIAAQLLVLRAYIPFLMSASSAAAAKKQANGASGPSKGSGRSGLNEKPHIQGNAMAMATQSCLGAAQAILRLGNKLNLSLSKEPIGGSTLVGPVLMDFYPLERMVLDAVVITQSSTAVSVVSDAEVRRGLDIMMERESVLGKERKEIWEVMKQRVLATGKLQIPLQGSCMKRKHDQLESPVAANGEVATSKKTEGLPSKHAKTTNGHPVIGVRYRQGRMLPTGPVHTVEDGYEGLREPEKIYVPGVQAVEVNHEQMNASTQYQQNPVAAQHPQHHMGSYVTSPTTFSPEQHTIQAQHRMSVEHTMAQQRASFDHQTKPIYHFDEAPAPPPTFTEYTGNNTGNGVAAAQAGSSSSSPYQSNTSFNPPHFGSPESLPNRNTPTSQIASDSPTVNFGTSDGQTVANYPVGGPPKFGTDSRPHFENPRPTFITDNPQPQYDKMSPFSHPGADVVQSPIMNSSASSIESHSHASSPSHFSVPQSDTTSHSSAGYFHTNGGVGPYETLSMRMEEGVPGTPMYEKPHMMYDKTQQHQMLQHGSHTIAVNAHPQHNILSGGFVGEQAQGLTLTGGPHPPHHTSHQSWSSAQPPQSLVGVPNNQPFWGNGYISS